MASKKQTYSEFLATSETFNDWLKQVPFGFWIQSMKVNDDNSVTFIFKNSLDTERFKPMKEDKPETLEGEFIPTFHD